MSLRVRKMAANFCIAETFVHYSFEYQRKFEQIWAGCFKLLFKVKLFSELLKLLNYS